MKYGKYLDKFNLKDKTFVITGANSGIGYEACKHLAYLQANIILACRNKEKAMHAIGKIKEEYLHANLYFEEYDQANLAAIENFAKNIKEKYQIDGLILNAGIYFPKKNMKTVDGIDLSLGTNYFGASYLIYLLQDFILKNKIRVVIVSSLTAYLSKKYPLSLNPKISNNKLYGYSKLLLANLSYELISSHHMEVNLVHPGICSTNILFNKDTGLPNAFSRLGRRFLNLFTHSASKASLTIIKALDSEYKEYAYITPRGIFAIMGYPKIKKYPKKYYSSNIYEKTLRLLEEKRCY